jgi:hypothetical protein
MARLLHAASEGRRPAIALLPQRTLSTTVPSYLGVAPCYLPGWVSPICVISRANAIGESEKFGVGLIPDPSDIPS